ncbi:hypothetical protein [Paraflavitalea sp. CAU 1676]|uniref:hypothetical protein n=1 Tax=Paraflavitalea sp. CAU 1676 TaxID=3032598 RepID=UPI0023D9D91C|nr:hypothetical protein [Paraflavitalea sp. CAU 1676]MDF2188325.1 hypothetical protein [Paraflavitalea sp. CAU 1676]
MMSANIINWFRISNWHDLKLSYQLVNVSVQGAGHDERQAHKAFHHAVSHLSDITKGPAAIAMHNGRRYVAVKADAVLKREVIAGSPLNIELSPLDGVFQLNCKNIDNSNLELVQRFLESAVNWQLGNRRDLWDGGINTFLKKSPLPLSGDIETDIFPGFKFKVVLLDKDNAFFCIDLAYRYADKRTLDEAIAGMSEQLQIEYIRDRNFLYLNGDNWYTVKGKSPGNPIDQHVINIQGKNITVLQYIQHKGKYSTATHKAPLRPKSPTFFHTNGYNSERILAGAACLAKRIRYPEDNLHKFSINEPNQRFTRIESFVKYYFQSLQFNGVSLQVAKKALSKQCGTFPLPALMYGKGQILDVQQDASQYGKALKDFAKRRREFVYKYGIINQSAFNAQHILFPDNLPLNFGQGLKYHFEKGMKQIAPQFPKCSLHQYSMRSAPYAHKVFQDLKEYIDKHNLAGTSILLVLPEDNGDGGRFNRVFHQMLKKELFNTVKVKCVSADKLKSFLKLGTDGREPLSYTVPDDLMRSFRSYLSYTLFECLIINRKWPFALAQPLHHDIYIGIDAHDFYAGFCFFFGNGEKIVFDIDPVAKAVGSSRNEKINHRVISDKIVSVLSRHLKVSKDKPGSIVILRDGVSFGEEEKALQNALHQLAEMKLLDAGAVKTGVINVAKTSAIPIRVTTYDDSRRILHNPDCGTYLYPNEQNKKDAFIFNTGYPYQVPGTSQPIHISYCCGNINFGQALQDIFNLTQITFSSPDRPTSLPLPLKLIDTLIRDVAHENDLATIRQKESNIVHAHVA